MVIYTNSLSSMKNAQLNEMKIVNIEDADLSIFLPCILGGEEEGGERKRERRQGKRRNSGTALPVDGAKISIVVLAHISSVD